MSKNVEITSTVLVLLLTAIAWSVWQRRDEEARPPFQRAVSRPAEDRGDRLPPRASPAPIVDLPAQVTVVQELDEGQRQAPAPTLRGRLVGPDGVGIGGAELRLSGTTTIPNTDFLEWWSPAATWTEDDESAPVIARSDAQGRFELPADVAGVTPAVVWFSRAGFRTAAHRIPGEVLTDWQVELQEAPGVKVEVVTTTGEPLAEAVVWQVLATELERRAEGVPADAREVAYLRIPHSTGQDGTGLLPGGERAMRVLATMDHLRSPAIDPGANTFVQLVLQPVFHARGRVVTAPGFPGPLAGARVTVRVNERNLGEVLGGAWVGPDGDWLLESIPWAPDRRYLFRLDSHNARPQEFARTVATPGGEEVIDFDARGGDLTRIRVMTPDTRTEIGIPGAEVRLWLPGTQTDWMPMRGRTDGEGRTQIPGSARGEAYITVIHPKCDSLQAPGPYGLPQDDGAEIEVRPLPGAVISGRCVHGGRPVRDFSVHVWPGGPKRANIYPFFDRWDGSFELPGVELTEVHIYADAPGLSQSEVQLVPITDAGLRGIELELSTPTICNARVLDSETLQPIRGATAQAYTSVRGSGSRRWGAARSADASGRIEDIRCAPTYAMIGFAAPGYLGQSRIARGEDPSSFDMGDVLLERPGQLELRLHSVPGGVEFEDCDVWGRSPGYLPMQTAGEDGRVVFQGMSPGMKTLIVRPGNDTAIECYPILYRGQPWVLDIKVDDEQIVHVDLLGDEDPRDYWLGVEFTGEDDLECLLWAPVDEEGRAEFPWVFGEQVLMWARADAFGTPRTLGVMTLARPDESPAYVDFHLDTPQLQLSLVGPSGPDTYARQSAWVRQLERGSSGPAWSEGHGLSAEGTLTIPVLDGHELFLTVAVEGATHCIDLPIEPAPEGSMTVRIEPTYNLRVRTTERGLPLPKVPLALYGGRSRVMTQPWDSGEEGTRDWKMFDPRSSVYIAVEGPDYWPQEVPVEMGRPGEHVIDVRRRGALLVRATSAGAACAGVRVALESVELSTAVDDWVAAGRVTSSDPALRTGADGSLRLTRLPNGPYRWRALAADGSERVGECNVPPLGMGELTIEF